MVTGVLRKKRVVVWKKIDDFEKNVEILRWTANLQTAWYRRESTALTEQKHRIEWRALGGDVPPSTGFYRFRNLSVNSNPRQRTRIFSLILNLRESHRTLDNFMLLLSFAYHLFCFVFHLWNIIFHRRNSQDSKITLVGVMRKKAVSLPVRVSPLPKKSARGHPLQE